MDCAWKGVTAESSSLCYAANPSAFVPAAKFLSSLPHPIDLMFRFLLLMLPKQWSPQLESYGGITIIDPESSKFLGIIQDPTGKDISHITGVTVHENKIYLGSLENDFIGVYDLE